MNPAVTSTLAAASPGEAASRVVETLATWAWQASWQGAVLAILVAMLLKLVGNRLSPGWRFALWGLVLVRLAVPPVIEVEWAIRGAAPDAPRPASRVGVGAPVARPDPLAAQAASRSSPIQPRNRTVTPTPSASAVAPAAPAPMRPSGDWARLRTWAAWTWAAGALLLALRVGWSSVRLAQAVRRTTPITDPRLLDLLRTCCAEAGVDVHRMPALRSLPAGGGPALVGFRRPTILLPPQVIETMSDDQLRLILLHELAHVRRRDILVNWAGTLVAVLHWPNPAAWLVLERMRYERELACDEFVLRAGHTPGAAGDRGAYARTIVRLAEALSGGGGGPVGVGRAAVPIGAVGILEGKTQLQRRLQMIARFDAKSRRWPAVAAGLGILVGALALSGATRAADKPAGGAARSDTPADRAPTKPSGGGPAATSATTRPAGGAAVPARSELSPEGHKALTQLLALPSPPTQSDLDQALRSLWELRGKQAIVVGNAVTNQNALSAQFRADETAIREAVDAAVRERHWGAKKGDQPTRAAAADDPASVRTAEKLKKPVQIQFEGQTLADALEFLRDAAGVDILVQWAQLEAAGLERNSPVTLKLREPTPVDAALGLMFRTLPVKLQFEIDKGAVVVGTADQVTNEVTRVYDVSDLVMAHPEPAPGAFGGGGGGGGPVLMPDDVAQLTRLIVSTVQPDTWRDAGGSLGSITSFKGKLVIKSSESVHKEVAQLLEMLRDTPPGKKPTPAAKQP
jgi:beta-lactamase regulating signal transducer with metallopeptidase domain